MRLAINVRDRIQRILTAQEEPLRQALRYIIHTREQPLNIRIRAQLELQKFSRYSQPTAVTRRCIIGGRSRSVLMPFKLSPIEFRTRALAGMLPGVKKSHW
ncbi:hypothetical protein EDD86DRAFT_194162 [Gorgonomyces haynaldii]|nr:hypothetical protein EDD86DRAFT_194162 [Gorgonomyces haynaldii]